MNNLQNSKVKTLDSREVAGMINKDHDKLLRDIRNFISQMNQANEESPNLESPINSTDFFIESSYVNSQNKNQPCYLLTKAGCEFVANKMTGVKGTAFTAKFVKRFNEMEETIRGVHPALSPMELLKLQYEVLEIHEEKLNEIDSKVETLSLTMNVSDGQAKTIREKVHQRVRKLCYGNESNAYLNESIRKKVYQYIWRALKDYLNVTVYHNILRKDYDLALNYIEGITLQGALLRDVQEANSQISFSEQ